MAENIYLSSWKKNNKCVHVSPVMYLHNPMGYKYPWLRITALMLNPVPSWGQIVSNDLVSDRKPPKPVALHLPQLYFVFNATVNGNFKL